MRRTNVLRLLPNREQNAVLQELADRTAALWNAANYRCRQALAQGGPVPGYETLCAEFVSHPAYRALPSDMAQETLKKVAAAWRSFFALRRLHAQGKLEHKPRPPRYWKDRRSGQRVPRGVFVKASRSYSVSRKALALALPSDLRQRTGDRLMLQTRGILRFPSELKTCELRFDGARRRWHVRVTVEMAEPVRTARPVKWAGIDTGTRILAAVAIEGNPLVRLYRAREVWRELLYWTRRIAREQSRLARHGLRSSRRLRQLHQKRRRRLLHALQGLARQVARNCRRAGGTHVGLEDLTGIRAYMDFGSANLLAHNFWAFRLWHRTLATALERVGIKVEAVEPRGTSSRCSTCGGLVTRPLRHKVACRRCGTIHHADANAAWNILRRAANLEAPSKGDGAEAKALAPIALRWNRHRWVDADVKSAAAIRVAFVASRDHRVA